MILVTGAAGFIGSNLAHELASAGAKLCLCDRPFNAKQHRNLDGLADFEFIEADTLFAELQSRPRPFTAIYHLGACSSTTETDWNYLRANNIEYSQKLWEIAAQLRIPLIYASSAATYGDGSRGFDDHTPPEQLQPLNLYGKSKNDFDAWALAQMAAGRATPPTWAGMKFFNVYGPREQHKGRMASVVYQAYRQIQEQGSVQLFRAHQPGMEDGGHRRDFVFVDDCIAHMIYLASGAAPSGIYNSGTSTPRRFLDLAHAVFAAMGLVPNIQFIPMPEDLLGKYQSYTKAELGKLHVAGYTRPATSLESGVAKSVKWLQEQDQK